MLIRNQSGISTARIHLPADDGQSPEGSEPRQGRGGHAGGKVSSGPQRRLRLLVPSVAVLVAALVAGCGGGKATSTAASSGPKAHGGTLNVGQSQEVIDLDPDTLFAPEDINVSSQINEPLFRENFEGKLVPWLVEKYETANEQRVWTLHLRQGVKFSNGKPLTSADVVFTLEDVRKNPNWASFTEGITSVKASSPSTVVITNAKPNPELPATLALYPFYVTPDNLGGESAKEFAQHPIGTGPFMLSSWKRGESLTLNRNPYYWIKDRPYLNQIVFRTITDPSSRVSELRAGQMDVIFEPPWSEVGSIEHSSETKFGNYPRAITEMLWLNAKDHLFSYKGVREAVNLALDREGMNKTVLLGHGEPGVVMVPKAVPFHNASIPVPQQDMAKAKELLAQALKGGAPSPSFTILVPNEDAFWPTAAQIAQQELDEAGFKVTLQPRETSSWVESLNSGKFEASFGYAFAQMPSPSELFAFYNGMHAFNTFASTAETKVVFAEALSAVNEEKRAQLYHKLQEIIVKEGYAVTVLYKPSSWAFRSSVSGFYVGISNIPYFGETSMSG